VCLPTHNNSALPRRATTRHDTVRARRQGRAHMCVRGGAGRCGQATQGPPLAVQPPCCSVHERTSVCCPIQQRHPFAGTLARPVCALCVRVACLYLLCMRRVSAKHASKQAPTAGCPDQTSLPPHNRGQRRTRDSVSAVLLRRGRADTHPRGVSVSPRGTQVEQAALTRASWSVTFSLAGASLSRQVLQWQHRRGV